MFWSQEKFIKWSLQDKKEIFSTLGQNFSLKDWELALELRPWFQTLKKELNGREWNLKRFEPTKNSTSSGRTNAISLNCNKWSAIVESVRKHIHAHNDLYYVPEL